MSKKFSGKIVKLYKNHGMIETEIDNHKVKLFFNVVPSMLDSSGNPRLHRDVTFETRKMTWHGINILCAYNIRSNNGPLVQIDSKKIKETDFSRFLFASLRPNSNPGKNTLDKLLDTERHISLFYLKWILHIEKVTKEAIIKAVGLIGKTSLWLISKLESTTSTKKIIKNALDSIKEKTWLLPTSSFVTFSQKDNDPNDVVVTDAPIELILSAVTLSELSDILKAIFNDLSVVEENNQDLYTYLWYAEGMISDLSIIRNAAAHGNVITPFIIDDTFDPVYFYEMSDAFPQWNSNNSINDAEKYKAFNFIRFLAKGEAKSGIHLTGLPIFSPQIEALYFTKSLFLNPPRKSLFSLFFLLHAAFSFLNDKQKDHFFLDLHKSGLSFYKDDEDSPFSCYPDKQNPISSKLIKIVWVILKYSDTFGLYAKVCKDV